MRKESASAFTLIELLIVMGIIVILMGLLFPAFRGAQDQAKKVQAKNDLAQIVTAITAYYTEYGRYPPVGSDDAPITNNKDLFDILRGVSQDDSNPRKITFMTLPDVKDINNPRAGIGNDGQFYDPWGTPYQIAIDLAYDGEMTNPYGGGANAGPNTLRQPIIAWSLGKNKVRDSNVKTGDDVLSWQ
jgi:prepilin-type N-terminal cleavage/methylation domain-containing protein